jgi:hypothetical protein
MDEMNPLFFTAWRSIMSANLAARKFLFEVVVRLLFAFLHPYTRASFARLLFGLMSRLARAALRFRVPLNEGVGVRMPGVYTKRG